MSKTLRLGDGQKLPKSALPRQVAKILLRTLEYIPDVTRVTWDQRPISVRHGQPWLDIAIVCKDGVKVRVRTGRRIHGVFIKCDRPDVVKVALEKAWGDHHLPVHLRRRTA